MSKRSDQAQTDQARYPTWLMLEWMEEKSNLGNGKSWAPLFLQDIKANATITVDVRMENLCPESYLQKNDGATCQT